MPVALGALLYGSGYIAQFLYNYDVWQAAGGVFGTAPEFPDGNFFICVAAVFRWPYGLYGVGGCVAALAVLCSWSCGWATARPARMTGSAI